MTVQEAINFISSVLESYGMASSPALQPNEMFLALTIAERRVAMELATGFTVLSERSAIPDSETDEPFRARATAHQAFKDPAPITASSTEFSLEVHMHEAICWLAASFVAEKFGMAPPGNTSPCNWLMSRYKDALKLGQKFEASREPYPPERIEDSAMANNYLKNVLF